jgi:hypothetical protein
MSHPFESSREKIERAKSHIDELETLGRAFLHSHPGPYLIYTKSEVETRDKIYCVHVREQPPDSWGPIIGEILYNLRSGLDHIAHRIVLDGRCPPNIDTGYPIGEHREAFESVLGKRVRGAGKKSIRVLRAQEPYGGGNDSLWWLHHLNIVDKHRFPLLVGSMYRSITIPFQETIRDMIRRMHPDESDPNFGFTDEQLSAFDLHLRPQDKLFPLKDGDEVYRVRAPADYPDKEEDPKFAFEIAFGEPEVVYGEPLLPTLNTIADSVEKVLEDFIALYERFGRPRKR